MGLKVAAEELGMTPQELIKKLDEAKESIDNGDCIEVNVGKLAERYL